MNTVPSSIGSLTLLGGVYFGIRAVAARFLHYREPQPRPIGFSAPKGVGGWLSLFIFSLIVGNPAMAALSYAKEAAIVRSWPGNLPGLVNMHAASLVYVIAGSAFSIAVGFLLLRERFSSYIAGREFLLFSLSASFSGLTLPLYSGLGREGVHAMIGFQLQHSVFQGVLYFIIWWNYLSLSSRVYRTYIQ